MRTIATFQKLTVVFLLVNSLFLFSQNANGQLVTHNVTVDIYHTRPAKCANSKDGYIQVGGSGPNKNVTFSIDNGLTFQSDKYFRNLPVGTYSVIARDHDGCLSAPKQTTVGFSEGVTLSITHTKNATCAAAQDGLIQVTAWGGTGTHSYSIDGGVTFQRDKSFKNLGAGTYSIIARDEDGCISSVQKATVEAGAGVVVQIYYQEDYNCEGWGKGRVHFGGLGGVAPYQFFIDGKPSSNQVDGLTVGKHTLTVVDAVGCSASVQTEVRAPYYATLSGDTAVTPNTVAFIKITIVDTRTAGKTLYTAKGRDNYGKQYTETNLKAGENFIQALITRDITYTIESIEVQGGSKCSGAVSGSATVELTKINTWKGLTDNWQDAKNWTLGRPSITDDVMIPATPNNPVIYGTGAIKNLSLMKGADLTVKGTLVVGGNVSIEEKFKIDASEGTLEYRGSENQQLDGAMLKDFAVKDIIVGNNLELQDSLQVFGTLRFTKSNNTFKTNDLLTLKSTANGTATVAAIVSGNAITGQVVVENYTAPRKGWKFLSVATKPGQTIHQAWQEGQAAGDITSITGRGIQLTGNMSDWAKKGFDRHSPAPSIKTYNQNTNGWDGLATTLAPFNHPTNAYMVFVRGDRSSHAMDSPETPTVLRSKGELKTGDQPVINVAAGKLTPVGNPYAAPLDVARITASADMFYYLWDPNLGNKYGAYQTLVKISSKEYMAVPGGGTYTSLPENIIPAGHAFFVSNQLGGTIQITESSKAVQRPIFETMRSAGFPEETPITGLKLKMFIVTGDEEQLVDGIFQNIGAGFSSNVDQYDAIKSTNTSENLSIRKAGKLLAVESMSLGNNSDTTILNLSGVSYATYRFRINLGQQLEHHDVVLVDKFTNTRTVIRPNTEVEHQFEITRDAASFAANRFSVIYVLRMPMPVTYTSVKAEKQHESVKLTWNVANEINVSNYIIERSTDGISFARAGKVAAQQIAVYSFTDQQPGSGVSYYRIVSVDIDGKSAISQIVKVVTDISATSIEVHPNPVVGSTVNLQIKAETKGIYYITITNQLGQYVANSQVHYNGGQAHFAVLPASKLSQGIYTMEVVHPTGERSVVRFIK